RSGYEGDEPAVTGRQHVEDDGRDEKHRGEPTRPISAERSAEPVRRDDERESQEGSARTFGEHRGPNPAAERNQSVEELQPRALQRVSPVTVGIVVER